MEFPKNHSALDKANRACRRNVLSIWWLWALILAFIVWSSGWGWGPGWGGWWSRTGGKTTTEIQVERQHEPAQQHLKEEKQELH